MKNLELFLVTFNRKQKLTQTLEQILAEDSPIKNLPLTILDNCSTDGTSEMLAEIASQHSNVTHIRHPKNIGGNANIARAFEMATAEYVWVLCDDDKLNFTAWKECKKLLDKKPAAVVVANYLQPQNSPAHLFQQLSFVPAAIYRTDLINSDTLINVYISISTLFPQLVVAAAAFNRHAEMPILNIPLVTMVPNSDNVDYYRGVKKWIHPLVMEMFWSMGYLQSINLLEDPKLRQACCRHAFPEDMSFYNFCGEFMSHARKRVLYTYVCGAHWCRGYTRILFILMAPLAWICSFYTDEKGIYVRFFGRIKIRIWKYLKPKNS